MNATKPSIRKFNPGTFQSDDELLRQFVVRKHELQIVLEVLSENINAKSCQHILVAGPRGRGKTMLLARVCAELRTNEALSQHLLPVRFMEESQEVTNLADFWLEALFHLAKTTAAANPEFSEELLVTHKDLAARWQDSNFEDLACAAVLGAADRIGRKLVLMVENLQSLSADLDPDFGWKLRKSLQSEPQIILLATATSQFKELREADGPFFELFRIIHLEPLSVSECSELWLMASGEERDSREIKPLRILTGGSPRLLVIVATYAEHRSLRQLLEELVALVDDHTEYFRGHLEVIAKTERRVYLAVLDLWQASSPAEIASRARMDVRSVSALLARLADRGIVLVEGSGRKRLYSAAERLYSIYYKLRRERDEATLVQQFIQFMTIFYSSQKLDEIFDVIRLEAVQSPVIREGFQRAMASDVADTKGLYQKTALAIDLDTAKELIRKAKEHIQESEHQMAIEVCHELEDRFGESESPELKVLVAIALVEKGKLHEIGGEFDAAMKNWNFVIERFGRGDLPIYRKAVAHALFCRGNLYSMESKFDHAIGDWQEIVERYGDSGEIELHEDVALAMVNKGVIQRTRGESDAARDSWGAVIKLFGESELLAVLEYVAIALNYLAYIQYELGREKDVLSTCEEVEIRFREYDQDKRFALPLWRTKLTKACALFVLEQGQAALDVFRSACTVFDPEDNGMVGHLMARTMKMIAAGASAGELAEILSAEGKNTGIVESFVIALRKHAGESVRAPAEVLEVAEDVREQIEKDVPKSGSEGGQ